LASVIRNAAAVFSRQALALYAREGLEVSNPFSSAQVRGAQVKSYSPMPRELVDTIWRKAPLLRDGDPDAEVLRKKYLKVDFRLPQEAAFMLLTLELGLGLRRNEADNARWEWVFELPDGRRFPEVRETAGFKPKSGQSRVIPIADDVWAALMSIKNPDSEYIVPGPPSESRHARRGSYRCDQAHRTLVAWLHRVGVNDPKPCHALRKEFGSYVATRFSLFHAQKLLGHSTPAVTSAYYANLIDLPDIQPMRMGE
jgi:integrase